MRAQVSAAAAAAVTLLSVAVLLISLYAAQQAFGGHKHISLTRISVRWNGIASTVSETPQQQPKLPAPWRLHHVFNGTSVGQQLVDCPAQWPPELQLWDPYHAAKGGTLKPAADKQVQAKGLSIGQTSEGSQQRSMLSNGKGNQSTLLHGQTLPLTLEALQFLWKHQHPSNCSNGRILVYAAVHSGIGSVLHVLSAALRAAVDSGRVLVEAPGHFLTSTHYCGGNTTLGSCYFLPLTNCTITPEELASAPLLGQEQYPQLLGRDPKLPRVVRINGDTPWVFAVPPLVFDSHLSTTSIPLGPVGSHNPHRAWWWRAISTAYIVRPNARTYAELAVRKRSKLVGGNLEGNCIGLYIRHGDKHRENEIFSNEQYEKAVEKLRSIDAMLTKQIFLSTEDSATVAYYRNSSRGWSTSFISMPMKDDPNRSNLEYMAQHGYHEEMLNGLLNLQMILQCSGFVGSIFSNWTRLIEELRSTVWCKAQAVYFDVKFQAPAGLDYVFHRHM